MSVCEERAARNEALFREVNEQVRAVSGEFGEDASSVGFVCECSDDGCIEQLQVPLRVYETVRADSRRFLIAPGHESAVEHVVDRHGAYLVVEKKGVAGRIAAQTDPRS